MHTFMPTENSDDGAAVFWNLDEENKEVHLAIAVHAEGWVGLGVAEAGGMIGSDIALFESSSPEEVIDSYVIEDRSRPLVDACQDWNLTDATVQDGWMIVELRRLLDTQDSQDHPIMNDVELWSAPTRLIAAWGDGEMASYHGNSKARLSVRLFANSALSESAALEKSLDEESDGYFEMQEDNYVIPANETTYLDFCKTFDELDIDQSGGISMIGAIPVITEETRRFIHHFTVYIAPSCGPFEFPKSMIYVWAPGDSGFALPSNVGFPMFHNTNAQAINVQIHYNNPSEEAGMLDSSGVRFYYVNEERDEMAAILELGDPLLLLASDPINSGLTKYQFTCPGECSANVGGGSVTVLNEFLHMHQSGVRMTNEVVRGEEVVHTSSVDVYDFDQQGGFRVPQESFELRPGDGFRTTCYYRDGDKFGLDSDEEMCIAFIMYYPAKERIGNPWMCPYGDVFDFLGALGCEQELEFSDLDSVDELERAFGTSNECAVDSLLPSPTSSPITNQPTNSARPSIDLQLCIVCSDGITADPDSFIPGAEGETCASLISAAKTTMLEGTPLCEYVKGIEPLCCPAPVDSSCNFCPSGLSAGNALLEVPDSDGLTCGDLVVYAAAVENESETCSDIMMAEVLCCPEENASTMTCSFCENGVTVDPEYVIPFAPNGETCGYLNEIAPALEADSEFCPQIQAAEPVCCPPTEVIEDTTPPTGSPKLSSTPSPTLGPAPNITSPGGVDIFDGSSVGAVTNDMQFTLILIFAPLVYATITLL